MTYLDPFESIGFHCSLTYKAFISGLEKKLKGTGITSAQYVALVHLIALGPISQSELAFRLSITRATGVRLVDRMERDGWVVRQPDAEDGRVKNVVPTEKSFKVWSDISPAKLGLMDEAYREIPPEEIETAKRVLEKVRKNLGS